MVTEFFFLNYTCDSLWRTLVQPFSAFKSYSNPWVVLIPEQPSTPLLFAVPFNLPCWDDSCTFWHLTSWDYFYISLFISAHPTLQSEVTLPWSSPVTVWKEHFPSCRQLPMQSNVQQAEQNNPPVFLPTAWCASFEEIQCTEMRKTIK